MGYALRKDGKGWRSISSKSDLLDDEIYSEHQPEIVFDLSEKYRAKRDALLLASDWTQVADAPVDKAAWAAYRDALRKLPEQNNFPANIVWPNQPE